jgi:periplasmic protein CpxP/Spy
MIRQSTTIRAAQNGCCDCPGKGAAASRNEAIAFVISWKEKPGRRVERCSRRLSMNHRIAIVAAALALTLGGLPVLAQQGRGGRGGPGGPGGPMGVFPGLGQVGLSDAQREQIRSIMEQERQTAGGPGEKVRQAEEALHAAVLADTPDQQAIEAAKGAANAAHAAELNARVELMAKIATVLTPAQRHQLATMPPPVGRGRSGHPKPYI